MKDLALTIPLMLVLVPVNLAIDGHHYWAGAAFGIWGTLVTLAIDWKHG